MLTGIKFRPGTFVKVSLVQKRKGIVVPTNAIIPDALSNQVVVVKNGLATFKNIETGVRTSEYVELLSGIEKSDSIIVSGVLFVRPDSKVIVKRVVKVNIEKH